MSKELENQIEAILFASGKGVDISKLADFCNAKEKEVNKALKELKKQYDEIDNSLQITEHSNKWKLTVKSKYLPMIEKMVSETELAQSVLKTLAMIAFKSPVLQAEIINARGQSAYDHVKELVKDKFITKDEHGRSYMLKITDKFYEYFDVEGDEEIRDVFAKLKEQQIQKLGELEIVDVDPKSEDSEEIKTDPLGLKIVDAEEKEETEEEIFQKKEAEKEEKSKQKEFLSDIDKKIEEISGRINQHKDEKPNMFESEDDEDSQENNNSDEEKNNETTASDESNNEEKPKAESKSTDSQNGEEGSQNADNNEALDSLENYADKEEKDEYKKENFL